MWAHMPRWRRAHLLESPLLQQRPRQRQPPQLAVAWLSRRGSPERESDGSRLRQGTPPSSNWTGRTPPRHLRHRSHRSLCRQKWVAWVRLRRPRHHLYLHLPGTWVRLRRPRAPHLMLAWVCLRRPRHPLSLLLQGTWVRLRRPRAHHLRAALGPHASPMMWDQHHPHLCGQQISPPTSQYANSAGPVSTAHITTPVFPAHRKGQIDSSHSVLMYLLYVVYSILFYLKRINSFERKEIKM